MQWLSESSVGKPERNQQLSSNAELGRAEVDAHEPQGIQKPHFQDGRNLEDDHERVEVSDEETMWDLCEGKHA
jgi:hypothetical protein